MSNNVVAIILAAGQSTRMKSKRSKILHPICGRPIIKYIEDLVQSVLVRRIIMVIGYQAETIQRELSKSSIEFVDQKEQLGTAHAVLQTRKKLSDFSGIILVLNGDTPLLMFEEIAQLIRYHNEKKAEATILSSDLPDSFGYGRIIRDQKNLVLGIVEEKDATEEQRKIKEINTGTYCFNSWTLYDTLEKINNKNANREYYLTDIIGILRDKGKSVHALKAADFRTALGINTRVDLAEANNIMRQRILRHLMLEGVSIIDPSNTYVDYGVTIGQDTIIEPGSSIKGASTLGEECYIGPFSQIIDSTLEDKVCIEGGCFISKVNLTTGKKVPAFKHIK